MTKNSSNKIDVSELYQVGFVVRDLEKSIKYYKDILVIRGWEIMEADSSTLSVMTYHGRKVNHRFKAAFAMVGPLQIELIQPLEGENIYSDFLEQHGEGIHHLGHIRVKNLDDAIRMMEKEGYSCLQSDRFPGGGVAYLDTTKVLGTVVELLEFPEGEMAPFRK